MKGASGRTVALAATLLVTGCAAKEGSGWKTEYDGLGPVVWFLLLGSLISRWFR